MQNYNWVSGRATSVLIDPADVTGNTVLLGGAYGGLWKSTNAGSLSSSPTSVTWQALIDDQPTLAVGAIALQPGNSNVILVGTGETNNSGDSYYGLGILGSTDGGMSWAPPIQSAGTGQSFLGIGFSKIAFSTANPNLVVAATAGDNGLYLGLEEDGISTARGLYFSADGGLTWNRVILSDGAVPASATSVIYNAAQGAFYAFIRRHGLYSSTDGQHFTRLTIQPTAGLASANCPAGSNASSCLIYRGEFAMVPGRNEMYVWVVDEQPDENGDPVAVDEGIWQTLNGGTGTGGSSWTLIPDNGITNCGDSAFGPNSGCGVEQGWYNLALSAIPSAIPDGTGTDIYAGAINLYKCTLMPGTTTCTQGDWINLTHVYGCNPGPLAAPAHVHPDQHGIAFTVAGATSPATSPGYFAHDGGISRTLDGYAGLNTGSCTGTNQFDSLSQTLGSMTELVSVSVDPANPNILLGGAQNNGSPATGTATSSSTFLNALGGDGEFTAINPTNPSEWFAANPYVMILKCEAGTACNDNSFSQVVGSNDLGGDEGAFATPYILDPQNSSQMLVGTCRVWSITTSGTAPRRLSNDFDTLGTGSCTGGEINLVNALAAGGPLSANGNSETVFAVTNGYGPLSGSPGGEVWATTDAGVTLMTNVTRAVNPQGYAISTVAMDSSVASGNTAYVGIMGFSTPGYPTSHVWQTTNAGASWTDWSGAGVTELPDNPVNTLLVDAQAGLVYAGTDVGVFVSSTSAPCWSEVGPVPGAGVSGFLPNAPVTALQLVNPNANPNAGSKTLVTSTYGRGIWSYIPAPDFAIPVTAAPNATVVNQNVTWNGALRALDGYSGSVTLSCVGVGTPGAPGTCTISPQTMTPTACGVPFTVTLGSATPGTFSFQIQGTDGTLTNSTPTETLTVGTDVTWADTGSASATVLAGQSASFTFSAAPVGGATFSSSVSFACNNLPALTNCVFSPASIAAGTEPTPVPVTLTITTTGPNPNPPSQQPAKTPRAAGTRGPPRQLPRSTHPKANAPEPPVRANLKQSEQRLGGRRAYASAEGPHASPLPLFALAWVMAGIVGSGRKRRGKPRLYGGIAVLCLGLGFMAQISCGGVAGSSSGTSGNFTIAVTPNPLSTSTPVNSTVTWNGMATATNGYSGTVALTCTSGAPATCEFALQVVTPTAAGMPFTVTLGSAATGTFTFTISGTDGTLTNATPTETLIVTPQGPAPDFASAVTPTPGSIAVNQNVTWNGTLTALNPSSGTVGGVNLTCTVGAPATCQVAPPIQIPAPSPGAPYTVALSSPAAGTFTVMIQGTDGTQTHTAQGTLTVTQQGTAPDFDIGITPSPSSPEVNQSVTWNGTLTALNGYDQGVNLSCTAGAPATCVIAPQVATPTSAGTPFTLTLSSATTGTFTFTIQGTDGTLTHATQPEILTVGDFQIALTLTPNAAGVTPQSAVWDGTLTALNGYIGIVTLSCTAGAPEICIPTGPVTPTTTGAPFRVTLGSATPGLFNFTIQATDGIVIHATPTETLIVGTVVTVSPATVNLYADETGNLWPPALTQQQLTATVYGSNNPNVTWAVTGGSAGGSISASGIYTSPAVVPTPATVTVTATSPATAVPGTTTVNVETPTPLGTYPITVSATAVGGAAHGDAVSLTVQ
jgi:hypothetical protein